ncbi:MAG: phage tail protein [Anaerolineales bacterium]|nr:phage tail protein [Anaerolineales bacterium]MCB0005156.1 phage tail protein [Anaerolineales bacterium]MCB0011969.1 phage tail protein [Anaerolineales bacterium]MCB0031538.1 phage tail protein [Anaerolineales bacterium]MCB8963002.1 phage tail protein [Ardenticatenales bacterium]
MTTLPLPAYNFAVVIDNTDHLAFAEVSGLAIELETVSYRHGLSFWEGEQIKSYKYEKPVTVSFKKGVAAGDRHSQYLYDWLKLRTPRQVVVSLLDATGQPLISWQIGKAYPVKLSAPVFDAQTNAVAIDTLELLALKITVLYS